MTIVLLFYFIFSVLQHQLMVSLWYIGMMNPTHMNILQCFFQYQNNQIFLN